MNEGPVAPPGYRAVFCMSFKHWRSGKDVFRKDGRPFCFFAKRKVAGQVTASLYNHVLSKNP
jgi:hypothetical protein